MRYIRLVVTIVLSSLLASMGVSQAAELPTPSGRIILTVSGSIAHRNSPRGAEFDYEMLSKLGLVQQQIDTPWTDAGAVFEGVMTRTLLKAVGATGTSIKASAANDYRIDIPYTDLADYDTFLGISIDGKRMTLRDKGPIWLLYSNDNHPPVAGSELNARMVWQLTTLSVQ